MDDYGMFSDEGDRMVGELVDRVLKLPIDSTDDDIYSELNKGMNDIEEAGHGEVHDTAVREAMIVTIENRTNRELTIYF